MKSELFIHWKAKERSYIVGGRTDDASPRWLGGGSPGGTGSGCVEASGSPTQAGGWARQWPVAAESGAWPFHAAGSLQDWPVLHGHRLPFSLFPAEVQLGDLVCQRVQSWPQGHRAPTTHCFRTPPNRCRPSLCGPSQGRQRRDPGSHWPCRPRPGSPRPSSQQTTA